MPIQLLGKYRSNRVTVFPPQTVTTHGQPEVDPQEVGMKTRDIDAIWGAVQTYYKSGLQPAMALCIRRNGKVIIDRAIGHSHGNAPHQADNPKIKATPRTLFNLFSASKCVTSMLTHLLVERGQLSLGDLVQKYIPEFGCHGKEGITVRDLLTHRAGIPYTSSQAANIEKLRHPEQQVAYLCSLKPASRPGTTQAYHALNTGVLLGEMIQRITGLDPRSLLQAEISEPLGLKNFSFGVAPELVGQVAEEAFTGPQARGIPQRLLRRALGLDMDEVVAIANHPAFRTGIVPSGNVISTADETCRFFEMLLRQGLYHGGSIFQPQTIKRAVQRRERFMIDRAMMLPVSFGLGFMLGGDLLSIFGPRTPRAFGHLGFTNVLAYADPERDISVAFLNNGKPLIAAELILWMRVMWTIGARIPRDYGGPHSPGPSWRD